MLRTQDRIARRPLRTAACRRVWPVPFARKLRMLLLWNVPQVTPTLSALESGSIQIHTPARYTTTAVGQVPFRKTTTVLLGTDSAARRELVRYRTWHVRRSAAKRTTWILCTRRCRLILSTTCTVRTTKPLLRPSWRTRLCSPVDRELRSIRPLANVSSPVLRMGCSWTLQTQNSTTSVTLWTTDTFTKIWFVLLIKCLMRLREDAFKFRWYKCLLIITNKIIVSASVFVSTNFERRLLLFMDRPNRCPEQSVKLFANRINVFLHNWNWVLRIIPLKSRKNKVYCCKPASLVITIQPALQHLISLSACLEHTHIELFLSFTACTCSKCQADKIRRPEKRCPPALQHTHTHALSFSLSLIQVEHFFQHHHCRYGHGQRTAHSL